jgi:putative Mn2+ efflux pump MntP
LAILYFIGGFLLFNKFEKQESQDKESNLNFIYTFLAIAISLFSIAVALVFSKLPLVISFIWLSEASIVLFFSSKLNSKKIFIAGFILCII